MGHFSQLIKDARVRADLNQYEVSEPLGYASAQFISNAERGLCGLPPDQYKKLAKILKISVDDLVDADFKDYKADLRKRVGLK